MNCHSEDLSGQTFGPWKVLYQVGKPSKNLHHSTWKCRCICGRTKVRIGSNLKKSRFIDPPRCVCLAANRCRPFEALFNTIESQANKRKLPFSLTYTQYLVFTKEKQCHYCGELLIWEPFNKMNGHKLDRKDNSLGYSKENCVVCCPRCNRAKSDQFTYEEWVQIGKVIRRFSR